jgi:nucleotide-binding universal stress UspA family protein
MKQIVVASDFSNCAGNAMEYAVELAKILNVQICVIHAIPRTEGIDNNVYNAIFIEEYYNNKRQALATWSAHFLDKDGYRDIPLTTLCEVGSLSSVLTTYMDANPVELLVMGSMGATGISGLFGSNASSMVSKTRVPILVVPLETKFSTNPVITLATDFSEALSPEDVTALNELILAFKSDKLNVLNVLESPEWKTNEAGESNMRSLIKNTTLEFKYITEDSTKEGIMNFVQGNNTDILCLVKHHHNFVFSLFNRSTVKQVMNKSIKAVLVLHT